MHSIVIRDQDDVMPEKEKMGLQYMQLLLAISHQTVAITVHFVQFNLKNNNNSNENLTSPMGCKADFL